MPMFGYLKYLQHVGTEVALKGDGLAAECPRRPRPLLRIEELRRVRKPEASNGKVYLTR